MPLAVQGLFELLTRVMVACVCVTLHGRGCLSTLSDRRCVRGAVRSRLTRVLRPARQGACSCLIGVGNVSTCHLKHVRPVPPSSSQDSGSGGGGRASVVVKTYNTYPFAMYVRFPMGAFEFRYTPDSKPKVRI